MTSLNPLPLTVAGASGRMGHMLIEAILASDDCRLAGALDIAASPALASLLMPFTVVKGTVQSLKISINLRRFGFLPGAKGMRHCS